MADLLEVATEPIAGADSLPLDHFFPRNKGLNVIAEIQKDIAALNALDDTGHQLTDPILIGLNHLSPLGITNALNDDLLRGLGFDAAEPNGIHRLDHGATDLGAAKTLARILKRHLQLRIEGLLDRPLIRFHHTPAPEGIVVTGLAINFDQRVNTVLIALHGRHP